MKTKINILIILFFALTFASTSLRASGYFWAHSEGTGVNGQYILWELNPTNGNVVQTQTSGVTAPVSGLAYGNGHLWAQSEGTGVNGQYVLWELNPTNGNVVQTLTSSVTAPISGLAYGNGALWAHSEGTGVSGQYVLWELNPTNGNVVQSLMSGVTAPVRGLAYGTNGYLWAQSEGTGVNGQYILWELNPTNGNVVQSLTSGITASVSGLAYANEFLWAHSEGTGVNGQYILWELNPANGDVVQTLTSGVTAPISGFAFEQQSSVSLSSSPANGGDVTGGGTYDDGASATVTAVANSCFSFVNWTEGGTAVSTSPIYSFNVSADQSLTANFAAITYAIDLSSSPSVGGTVIGAGSVNCGENVTVTASGSSGYSFVDWTENGAVVSSSPSYSFTATQSENLVANFSPTISTSSNWTEVAALPIALLNPAVATMEESLYVAGGNGGTPGVSDIPEASLYAYNPLSNSWSSFAPMPAGRFESDGAAVINNRLYVVGGWATASPPLPNDNLWVYDPVSNAWAIAANLPILSADGASGAISNELYVTTPDDGYSGYFNFLNVYNPVNNSWTALAPSAEAHHAAGFGVINNRLYVVGGLNDAGVINNLLEVYDPSTNGWTTLAPMPTARDAAASAVLNGKLYVMGGSDAPGHVLNTVESYDPVANSWATEAPMPTARADAGAGVVQGVIYVVGGYNGSADVAIAEAFTPTPSAIGTDCDAPPSGLISWWPGDGNADDIIGGNNGTLVNGAGFTNGLVGECFNFDGDEQYMVAPDQTHGLVEGTVEFWFYANQWNWDSVANYNGILLWCATQNSPPDGDFDGMDLGTILHGATTTGELLFGIYTLDGLGWHWAHSGITPQPGNWYHVAGTWGPLGIQLYVNGSVAGSNSYTGSAPPYTSYNVTGHSSWPDSGFAGLIDELSIYNRALTANEISAIYAAGSAGKCLPISPQITNEPVNQAVALGGSAAFMVGATGTAPLSYQWQKDGSNLTNMGDAAGATNATLVISPIAGSDAGNYTVIVSNLYGAITSTVAILIVTNAPLSPWVEVAPLPVALQMPVVAGIGNTLYVAGGNGGEPGVSIIPEASLYAFNSLSNSWSTLASMPAGRYMSEGAAVGNEFYVVGGWTTSPPLPNDNLWVYDLASDSWIVEANLPLLSAGGAAGAISNELYVTTPDDGYSGYFTFLDVYNPASNAWTALAQSSEAHHAPGYGVIGDKLYVAGGQNDAGVINSLLEVYDPSTNGWTILTPMPTARFGVASAVLNGKLYVMGGVNPSNEILSTLETYDPVADKWTTQTPLPAAVADAGAGVVNGVIYVVGGYNGSSNVSAVEAYAPLGPPAPGPIGLTNNLFSVAWHVMPGRTYQVQYSTNLAGAVWMNLRDPEVASSALLIVSDAATNDQRFYRIVLENQ